MLVLAAVGTLVTGTRVGSPVGSTYSCSSYTWKMLGRCHVKVAYVEEFSTVWVMKGRHSDSGMYASVGVAVGVAVGVDVGVAVGIEVAADAEEFVTPSVLLVSSVLLLVYRWR
jgi:hypothetical protein